jgi:hypothetical protein
MSPDPSFAVMADGILHAIPMRVLTHVKHLSEGNGGAVAP